MRTEADVHWNRYDSMRKNHLSSDGKYATTAANKIYHGNVRWHLARCRAFVASLSCSNFIFQYLHNISSSTHMKKMHLSPHRRDSGCICIHNRTYWLRFDIASFIRIVMRSVQMESFSLSVLCFASRLSISDVRALCQRQRCNRFTLVRFFFFYMSIFCWCRCAATAVGSLFCSSILSLYRKHRLCWIHSTRFAEATA